MAPASTTPLPLSLCETDSNRELFVVYSRAILRVVFQEFQVEARKMLLRQMALAREIFAQLGRPEEVGALRGRIKNHLREFLEASLECTDATEARFRQIYEETAPEREG